MTTDTLDWYEQAACRDLDPDRFDYDPEADPPAKAEAAKGVCAGCAVRDACLDFALERPAAEDTTGIYGGLTPAERLARRSGAPSSRRLVADPRLQRSPVRPPADHPGACPAFPSAPPRGA